VRSYIKIISAKRGGGMTDEWIKKMWYIYTKEFYSAIKKNEIMLFAGKWMKLENFMLSEVRHAQRSHVFPEMWKLDL
jgi:hypothetical protein